VGLGGDDVVQVRNQFHAFDTALVPPLITRLMIPFLRLMRLGFFVRWFLFFIVSYILPKPDVHPNGYWR
jgi:hypothetical protein